MVGGSKALVKSFGEYDLKLCRLTDVCDIDMYRKIVGSIQSTETEVVFRQTSSSDVGNIA